MCYFCPDWESKTLENIAVSQLQKWKWNTLVDTNLYVVKSEPFLSKVFEETVWVTAQEGKGIAHYIQDFMPYF